MNLRLSIAGWALLLGAVSSCSDSDGDGTSSPGALQTQLAGCPVVSQSSDPAASVCLQGTFTGVTLSGATCTLTIGAAETFAYASPTLSFSYTPVSRTIRIFDHSLIQGLHQVIWSISDPLSASAWREFRFTARFGTGVPATDVKLEIEATEHGADGGSTSSNCTVSL